MIQKAQQQVRRHWRTVRPLSGSKEFLPVLVSRTQILLATKAAVAAGIAWAVALLADPHSRPYFAPLAVILIVQPTIYDSLSRAFQRVVGVLLGVAAALAVSHFLAPSGWSIGIIVFAGLLVGWSLRLGPQGVVQVPVSALLVFAVGSAIPGYAGRRVVETLIGSAIAVMAVLVSPSAPTPEHVLSDAATPLHRSRDILSEIGPAIGSAWTLGQAEAWRREALDLFEATARARRDHEGHQLTARWNARARRQRLVLDRAEEALRVGDRIAIQTRSITRALVDGAPAARPMPAVGAMLVSTASAIEAYAVWVASPGDSADRQQLSDAIRVAGETFGQAVAGAQQRWRDDPAQWLTFGTILTMSQRILAEVSTPLEPPDEAA
jgi:Fusaric acid resistance protein-like